MENLLDKEFTMHMIDIGIINTSVIPENLGDKLKIYSGWKIANIELNGNTFGHQKSNLEVIPIKIIILEWHAA